jgi:uncharacterized protein YjbI with pentapeptide repeats
MLGVELEGCDFTGARLNLSDLDGARIVGGCFSQAVVDLCHMEGAVITGGDWSGATMVRVSLDNALLDRVVAKNVNLSDVRLVGARLVKCDLRGATLRRLHPLPRYAGRALAHDARFDACDLRGVDLDGLALRGAVFRRCGLHGTLGKPVVDGPYIVEEPDLSPLWDGNDLTGAAHLYARWGAPA